MTVRERRNGAGRAIGPEKKADFHRLRQKNFPYIRGKYFLFLKNKKYW